MKNLVIFLMVFFFAGQSLLAQKVKFRKVSKSAFEQSVHPLDAEAEAAVLYQECRRYYVFSDLDGWFKLHTKMHQRIKIYSKEGMSYADFSIPHHDEGRFAKFRAYTYNLEDGKVKELRLDDKSVFTEDVTEFLKRRKFAMPGVIPGSVIDIEYELVEPSTIALQPFYMQHAIPVDYSKYIVEIPEYFRFNKAVRGLPIPIDVSNNTKSGSIVHTNMQNSRQTGRQVTMTSGNVRYGIDVETYVAENVPALKNEPFVPSMSNYYAAISHELSFIQFGAGKVHHYSTTWDEIADKLMTHKDFGNQINLRLGEMKTEVEGIMELPADQRMAAIYYFVRDNYSWNGNYGELTENGLNKLLKEKSGNVGDINLLLVNMLKKAQLDVQPVVMSSRDNGFLNINYPTWAQINYVIALVRIEDHVFFLDATGKNLLAGYLPHRALNLDGIIISDERKGIRIDIANPNVGNTNMFVLAEVKDDFSITGQARVTYQDYHAVKFRSAYRSTEKEGGYLNELHDHHPDLELTEHNLEQMDGVSNQVVEFFNMKLEAHIDQMGDLLFLNPLMIWQSTENQYKSESREFAVFYNSTGSEKYMISIKLPEGYMVETLPEPVRLLLPENMGSFLYSVTDNAGTLVLQYQFDLLQDIIAPNHYQALRNFMIMVLEKQAEKVVLKKV
jgi:hypothetical protein